MPERSKFPAIRHSGFTEAWEQRKLGDVTTRIVRKNKNHESTLPLTISSIYGLIDQIAYFNNRVASRDVSNYYLVKRGEFAYNKSYSDGFPWGSVKRLDLYEMGVLSTLYIVFALDSDIVDSNYLVSYYETDNWHREVAVRAAEGARNHGLLNISANDFFDTALKYPKDYTVQKKIGQLFVELDRLIALHNRDYDKTVNVKKVMLEKMFPKNGEDKPEIRFSGFTGAWEQQRFDSVFKPIPNNSLPRANLNYDTGKIKSVHYGDILINYNSIVDCSTDLIPFITGAEAIDFQLQHLKDGDILIADAAEDETVGKAVEIAGISDLPVVSGLHTIACRPKNRMQPKYLGYFMNSPLYHQQLLPIMQGTKVLSLSRSNLANTVVNYPTIMQEQAQIAQFFMHLDSLIILKQFELEKLQNIKKALLEKMFV